MLSLDLFDIIPNGGYRRRILFIGFHWDIIFIGFHWDIMEHSTDAISPAPSTPMYPEANTSFIFKPVDQESNVSDASSLLQAQIQEAEALCKLATLKRQLAEEQQKAQSDCTSERSRVSRRDRLKRHSAGSFAEECLQKTPIFVNIGKPAKPVGTDFDCDALIAQIFDES